MTMKYKIGDKLDVLDSAFNWLEGTVVETENQRQELLIYFSGWLYEWNELIHTKSVFSFFGFFASCVFNGVK